MWVSPERNNKRKFSNKTYLRCESGSVGKTFWGLRTQDAKIVCKFARVSEKWTAFERDKPKRDFANSIRIRAKLYGARFEKGKYMDNLEDLEDFRRQLDNMNDSISDADIRVLNTLCGEAEMDQAEEEMNGDLKNNSKCEDDTDLMDVDDEDECFDSDDGMTEEFADEEVDDSNDDISSKVSDSAFS
ncbi:hypothetical protein JG688_00010469, partial [Phytophthora aleatoria]